MSDRARTFVSQEAQSAGRGVNLAVAILIATDRHGMDDYPWLVPALDCFTSLVSQLSARCKIPAASIFAVPMLRDPSAVPPITRSLWASMLLAPLVHVQPPNHRALVTTNKPGDDLRSTGNYTGLPPEVASVPQCSLRHADFLDMVRNVLEARRFALRQHMQALVDPPDLCDVQLVRKARDVLSAMRYRMQEDEKAVTSQLDSLLRLVI